MYPTCKKARKVDSEKNKKKILCFEVLGFGFCEFILWGNLFRGSEISLGLEEQFYRF